MDWTRGHTIGQGSSATVSMAVSHRSGHIFAVKSAEFSKSQFLQKEQKIISTLNSPHIVSYKGYDITMENNQLIFNLMMEYVSGGTLSDAIREHGLRLKESMIACYARQILQGLNYLHSNGIVHCDIKGHNILLAEDGAKIADFGCSKQISTGPIGGTPMFMAPEAARWAEQGFPADIWALGCTVIEMATGGPPWPNATCPASVLYQIAFSDESPKIPDFLSDQAKDLLRKCLTRNPNERWTAEQLLKHPFLQEFNSNMKMDDQEFDSNSPTSILDLRIWNSMEDESEFSCKIIQKSFSNSGYEKVKALSSKSRKAKWTWEETWIKIRSNEEDVATFASNDMKIESKEDCQKLKNKKVGSNSLIISTCMKERDLVNIVKFERYKHRINQF